MNKKVGLLLLPLVPLSAMGIVNLVNRALPVTECQVEVRITPDEPAPRAPQPTPAPVPAPPHTVTAD